MNARDLADRLAELLRRERDCMAQFLVALAEFDRQQLWLGLGYSSLFAFVSRRLGLSESATFFRVKAAQLMQRYPELVEPLRDGRLCMSTMGELAKVITPENRAEVIPRFFHHSKQQARELVAVLKPVETPPTRDVVRPVRLSSAAAVSVRPAALVPAERGDVAAAHAPSELRLGEVGDANSPAPAVNAPLSRPAARDVVDPLTAELSRLSITVSPAFLAKLRAARDALSHCMPGATTEDILSAGLDLVLAEAAKRRGAVQRPQEKPRPSKDPGHVTAAVRRAVFERDGGCCQFPVDGGGVCGSTYQVEVDHLTPKALGGTARLEDLRLACRAHNIYAARQVFGDEHMSRWVRVAATGPSAGRDERSAGSTSREGARPSGDEPPP
jgi:hypothetical protein